MNLSKLWQQRCRAFWLEVAPYIRYVISGGLGVFIVLFFTVGGYFYATMLQQVTPQFPAATVGMALLVGFIGWSSIRTYLQKPDQVFLVPVEHQMDSYIKRAVQYSVIIHVIPFTLILLIYWPVYERATGASGGVFLFIWFCLLAIKLTNLRGGWVEQQMRETHIKRSYAIARWVISALLIWLIFAYPVWKAGLLIFFTLLALLVSLGLAARLPFHWERLIAWEQQHRSRIYMFLSGFADVEQLPQQVRKRTWLARLSQWIPFRRESAYTYLYFKTWLRSDLFTVVWRLTLIGIIVIALSSIWWVKIVGLSAILFLVGVQLSTLRRTHQHAIWLHVYPLPETSRLHSIARLSASLHFMVLILLLLPLFLTSIEIKWLLGSMVVGILLILIFYARQKMQPEKNDFT